ncbi:MAG: hypothetical protein QNJ16_09340 [Rhodobacter sp.]|nr:hypothetical protein [Rhodobacter sp.]
MKKYWAKATILTLLIQMASAVAVCAQTYEDFELFPKEGEITNPLSNEEFELELQKFRDELGYNQDFAITSRNKLWCENGKSARGARVSADGQCIISVCWKQKGFDKEKSFVISAVNTTWGSHRWIGFAWFDSCTPNFKGIVIKISDSGPHTLGLGNQLSMKNLLKKYGYSMLLNFEFRKWKPTIPYKRDVNIRVIAVHEFGHALGYYHEHNRLIEIGKLAGQGGQTKWVECSSGGIRGVRQQLKAKVQGSSISQLDALAIFTQYDPDSIMNYCNRIYNREPNLSKFDRELLNLAYPRQG